VKKLSESVETRLRRKKIAIVDYIYKLRESVGLSQTDMAKKMGVKDSYLSRILSGPGTNLTLVTIAKCEDALQAQIIVTPGDYEELLIKHPDRLLEILSVANAEHPDLYIQVIRSLGLTSQFEPKAQPEIKSRYKQIKRQSKSEGEYELEESPVASFIRSVNSPSIIKMGSVASGAEALAVKDQLKRA
jgi:transcriptional regulator with XRE-family HTH domain